MRTTIRPAGPDDLDALALLGSASFLETFAGMLHGPAIVRHCLTEHSRDRYARFLDDGASLWIGEVDEGGAPIGYALLSRSTLERDSGTDCALELKRIYVLSRYHGLGIADRLLAEVIAEAHRRLARTLSLGVFNGNARAIRFYDKNGFSMVGTRRFRIGDREYDDHIMSRTL